MLPFLNLTGNSQTEYFSDGLTEELLDHLAQIDGLRVPARTSSFQFKNKAGDIGEIGHKLRSPPSWKEVCAAMGLASASRRN